MSENLHENRLNVKVTPNAGRNEVTGYTGGVLNDKIAAPPVKGRANKELVDFLSRSLGVSKSLITIVKGRTSRNKVIIVQGMTRDDVIRRLIADKKEGA